MSTASDGRRREHQVRDAMIEAGWTWIMRAAASKGPADLLMAHPEHGAALVQVGSKSKDLGPAARERFMTACELVGALAILAVVIPRQGISWFEVNRGPGKSWGVWSP